MLYMTAFVIGIGVVIVNVVVVIIVDVLVIVVGSVIATCHSFASRC